MLRFDRRQQNSVKQLSLNKKIKRKKSLFLEHRVFNIKLFFQSQKRLNLSGTLLSC